MKAKEAEMFLAATGLILKAAAHPQIATALEVATRAPRVIFSSKGQIQIINLILNL